MLFVTERIRKLLSELRRLTYPIRVPITSYRMTQTAERFEDIAGLDTLGWQEITNEQLWGGHREYFWFETKVTIPPELDGKCVVYRLHTMDGDYWDALNPQFMLYVNGQIKQGLDVNHMEALLAENAKAGDTYRIVLSAFTGDHNFSLKMRSALMAIDRKTEKYYYDIKIPLEVAERLPEESADYIHILQSLNESLNRLDLRQPDSKAYAESLEQAQAYLDSTLYTERCGKDTETVYCVGHTHIDVAWLWTLRVTEDKAARSFATVLELMRQYPEYIFMSSQPQLYQFVKKNVPEVYAEIKRRIQEGRWEPDGGMWVEADCNISSGESLVRQFIYGKRFFREEFGKDNVILWLPDVFGYSAALPQIMDKCGIKYFMTTKISWSEMNRMPYDTFLWEGIDGTRILTHFIPARGHMDTFSRAKAKHVPASTYNGNLNANEIMGGWQFYQQKQLNREVLMSFGHGDGGGGPTKDMLEAYRRLSKGIPGAPVAKMSTARDFFHLLDEHVSGNKKLPAWVGELYLEYHRGTYTSMARNKNYNRRAEFTYQNAEMLNTLAKWLCGAEYPLDMLRDGWETILLNQFHDILPGSSIKEVYEDSKAQYEKILLDGGIAVNTGLQSITKQVDAPRGSLVVCNPNGMAVNGTAMFTVPEDKKALAVYDGSTPLPVQETEDGCIFTALIPAKGYKTFTLKEVEAIPGTLSDMIVSPTHLENAFFRITLNEKGQFTSLYDKQAARELIPEGSCGNVIMSYEDKPHNYDAWDINHYYTEKSWEVDEVSAVEVLEKGPVRSTLKITHPYLDSVITQYIRLYKDIPRIDIEHDIDWKEKQILLKCLFPVDIHANEATFEIQYGNVTRPTHANTSWDFAKFEVCVHKWLDISEDGYGISFLNDCKYGCHVKNGVVGLTMLKSAISPNPDADREQHRFTYALYPHKNGWREAGTVAQAYLLNNPLLAAIKENENGKLPPLFSFVSCDKDNVIVEVLKQAEDSEAIILRLYECHNRRTDTSLRFGLPVSSVWECDMLEENDKPVALAEDSVSLLMKPYEIKTLKIKVG